MPPRDLSAGSGDDAHGGLEVGTGEAVFVERVYPGDGWVEHTDFQLRTPDGLVVSVPAEWVYAQLVDQGQIE